ncbi:MAG: enoyl-CoA hydratase/isomerase family protein [Desulfobacteraceae bacterium]|nr:enoyl-CoA hydratase/isomerase family protein [Desulfobacteraceae bacterium]MBC2757099.1 enoyl-CoA hydratase/isomerase family protein [Desulfobacteraceae bacterium]MBC2763685.1 enoyl-CoA hydratase/isomerase family protein [ANME-2 cluster archaeon]
MSIIEWEKDETVAIIKLNNGENRQNLEFAQTLSRILDKIIEDKSITAAVITSTDPKCWSLGVDIDWLGKQFQEQSLDNIKNFMYEMNNVFKKLLLLPIPVIAAINGHAFGNGAILSCACDFRFMKSDRGYFCFPEVDLGIPFLPGMIAFVKKAIPGYKFNELKLTGKKAGAAELAESHVIEKACADADELLNKSISFARAFNKKRGIFKEHKKRMHKQIIQVIDTEDKEFIEPIFLMVQD